MDTVHVRLQWKCITFNNTRRKERRKYSFKSVPIGNPTDHSELFVLDMNEKFVPINVIGELCICGDCIGKGYVDIKKIKINLFLLKI